MAGDKTWAANDVLTAADMNGYVRDQTTAIVTSGTRPTTTQTGRTIYETDTGYRKQWDNTASAWEDIGQSVKGLSNRNVIVNGNMAVRQRGNGPFTTANAYGIDQWKNFASGSTFSNTAAAFTAAEIPSVAEGTTQYHYKTVVSSSAGAGNYVTMAQYLEGVHTLAGRVVTLSFWAKADAARPIALEFLQNFGSGGSPSSEVDTFVGKPTLSTSWTRYQYSFTAPSISGKTLGTANDFVGVNFWFDAGSTYNSRTSTLGQQSGTFYIWGVQLEEGSGATQFEQEPTQVTLAKCQRYLFAPTAEYILGQCISTTRGIYPMRWPVGMRTTPTATLPAAANWTPSDAGGTTKIGTTVTTAGINSNGGSIDLVITTASFVAGNASYVGCPTGTYLSAEL